MLPEQINTINDFKIISMKEKSSEFLAIVNCVDNEDSTVNQLQTIRKKYYDANHHCYAYKLKTGEVKYSDDGEPNGTAGIRILNAIEHFDLYDVLLIVVRYFGGTKLGIGPLGKAYYNASIGVLSESKIINQSLYKKLLIETDFSFIKHVHRVIKNYSAIIAETDYTNIARFNCLIKPMDFENINIELSNLTNGQILIKLLSDIKYL